MRRQHCVVRLNDNWRDSAIEIKLEQWKAADGMEYLLWRWKNLVLVSACFTELIRNLFLYQCSKSASRATTNGAEADEPLKALTALSHASDSIHCHVN